MTTCERSRVVRLRGLPFTATSEQVRAFFASTAQSTAGAAGESELALEPQQVFICRRDGRPTGEAYVALASPEQAARALAVLNKCYMGSRYIELFEAAEADVDAVQRALEADRLQGCVVRLRGLPYSASAEDVARFFDGVALSPEPDAVVFVLSPSDGRRTGEAFVQLASAGQLPIVMNRHKELLGRRYIEVFHSSKLEKLQEQQQQQQQQLAWRQQLHYHRLHSQQHRWQAGAAAVQVQAASVARRRVVSGVAMPPSSMPGSVLQGSAANSAVMAMLPAGAVDGGIASPSSGMVGMPSMGGPAFAPRYAMMGPGTSVQYVPVQGMWPSPGPAGMMQDASMAGMAPAFEGQAVWLAGTPHPGAPAVPPHHAVHLPRAAWS